MSEEREEHAETDRERQDREWREERDRRERARERERREEEESPVPLPRNPYEAGGWLAKFFAGLSSEKAGQLTSMALITLVGALLVVLILRMLDEKHEAIPAVLRSQETQITAITVSNERNTNNLAASNEKNIDKILRYTDDKLNKFMASISEERRQDREERRQEISDIRTEMKEHAKVMNLMLGELVEWRREFKKTKGADDPVFAPDLRLRGDRDLKPLAPPPRIVGEGSG